IWRMSKERRHGQGTCSCAGFVITEDDHVFMQRSWSVQWSMTAYETLSWRRSTTPIVEWLRVLQKMYHRRYVKGDAGWALSLRTSRTERGGTGCASMTCRFTDERLYGKGEHHMPHLIMLTGRLSVYVVKRSMLAAGFGLFMLSGASAQDINV